MNREQSSSPPPPGNEFRSPALLLRLWAFWAFVGVPIVVMFYPFDLYGNSRVLAYLAAMAAASALYQWTAAGPLARWASRRFGPAEDAPNRFAFILHAALLRKFRAAPAVRRFAAAVAISAAVAGFILFSPFRTLVGVVMRVVFGGPWYVFIVYALNRPLFAFILAASAGCAAASRKLFGWPRGIAGSLALFAWLTVCAGEFYFSAFKWGPPASACKAAYAMPGVRPVLTRNDLKALPGQARSLPYDSVLSGDGNLLFVSLKRIDKNPGAVAAVDLTGRSPVRLTPAGDAAAGVNAFPERLSINVERRQVYAPIFSPGAWRLQVIDYADGDPKPLKTIPLPGEPNNVFADLRHDRIVVLFANDSPKPIAVYDAATFEEFPSELRREDFFGDNQYLAFEPDFSRFYLTNVNRGRLFEIETKGYTTLREARVRWPFVGVALDSVRDRIYMAGPLNHSVFVRRQSDLGPDGVIPTVGGLADLAVDEGRGILYVGHYGGVLEMIDVDSRRSLARLKLGYLLRNIYLDPESRRLFVCSGCGVFEVLPDEARKDVPGR